MSGSDALLWHLQRDEQPTHTLKTALLDTTALGRPLTLEDLRSAFNTYGGRVPFLTMRAQSARWFPGRPFWVHDHDFDLDQHLDEIDVDPPGGRAALDMVHSELATRALPRDRPPWAATLVSGLADGRQALVVRLHHAVADGGAALNCLLSLTSVDGTPPPEARPYTTRAAVSDAELRRAVLRGVPTLMRNFFALVGERALDLPRVRRVRRSYPGVPAALAGDRKFLNSAATDGTRVCASISLPFEPFRRIADRHRVTVNGIFHALIAAALRDELLEHGESAEGCVAAFGIATGEGEEGRTLGNFVSPAAVCLATELDDPNQRLLATSKSCTDSVALARAVGLELTGRWAEFTCRIAPRLQILTADRTKKVYNHVTTANVRGPAKKRRAGPVVVDEWISFALAMNPANVNITAYSYAGRMIIGLVAARGALPDNARFLARMEQELSTLDGTTPVGEDEPAS